jgi:DNA-directed RNA polymerase specialized sigma24 family protein
MPTSKPRSGAWWLLQPPAMKTAKSLSKVSTAAIALRYIPLRRRGFNRQDAQDLTQDFFLRLLEKETLSRADPQKGKFRTFLLGALNFFIAHFHERAQAQKRGGGSRLIYLDDQTAEEAYQLADPGQTPEQIFEARWAATLMERTILGLQSEMEAAGKGKLFDELKGFLIDGEDTSYQQMALRVGVSLGALKTTIHRLRGRYRDLLRQEVARTVSSPTEVDDEIRSLSASLQSTYR